MYSREQYEKAFELRKEGFTYKQITQILNLKTINTAYGWIKRNYKPQGKFLNINFNNLSAELAYVLGVIEGDGYIGFGKFNGSITKGHLGLEVKDKDFALYFENQLEKWSGLKISFRARNNSDRFVVTLYSLRAAQFINDFDLNLLINAEDKIKTNFLKGLFDSEGNVSGSNLKTPRIATRFIGFFNNNLELIYLVKKLLESLDIKVQNIDKRTGIGFKKSGINYRLRIGGKENLQKFSDKIGFSIERKNKKLNEILKSYKTK